MQTNGIVLAFAKIGIPSQYTFLALFATLFGSFLNLPVKTLSQDYSTTETWVTYFSFRYVIPMRRKKGTLLTVNLGGALISLYLLFKTGLWASAILPTAFMTAITFRLAKPIPGIGLESPFRLLSA